MNKKTFSSRFSERIIGFIAQKHALGYDYASNEYRLRQFDQMCVEHFPDETTLTREICLKWAVRKETESVNTFRGRLPVVREFAKYLARSGELAYVLPSRFAPKATYRVPHIYSEEEVARLWFGFDRIPIDRRSPLRHLVIPAVMRVLYCCGLRPCEARRLRKCDVDLECGKLEILESKGHKNRTIMLSDDLTAYLRVFDEKVSLLRPGREMFFSKSNGKMYANDWLHVIFHKVCNEAGIRQSGDNVPRVYDLRHTFATHRLYKWMREGKDLTAKLPYLRAYMGHELISDTYYYIHLVPGLFETMSGFDYSELENLIPEVEYND